MNLETDPFNPENYGGVQFHHPEPVLDVPIRSIADKWGISKVSGDFQDGHVARRCVGCGGGVSILGTPAGAYQREKPLPFVVCDPEADRAIAWPWLSTASVWEELRFSIRSVVRFFEDKDCPLVIVGDAAPHWFREGGRLRFIKVPEYGESREKGLFAARAIILQLARKVIYMNDDIYFLKPTGWKDMETALTEGDLTGRGPALRGSPNRWQRGLGMVAEEMKLRGKDKVSRFATHTPFLFEIEKAREILSEYRIPHSGGFESLYHNHFNTPHRPVGKEKTNRLPCQGSPRFLNHKSVGPDASTKDALAKLFPEAGDWESGVLPVVTIEQAPSLGISLMTHPSRREMTARLIKALGAVPIAEDDGRGLLGNCEAAWRLADVGNDYHVVIQDDAILCTDFVRRARLFLARLDKPEVVSFYFGNRFSTRNVALNAMDEGKVSARLMWGVAICIPTAWIPEMLEFFRRQSRPDDDGRISDWLISRGRTATYSLPCLVDHEHSNSLVGNSNGKRKAVAFLG